MAEYIEREAAIRALLNDAPEQVGYSREDAADCIRYIDAADVAPVRHGKWNRPYISGTKRRNPYCFCTWCGQPVKPKKVTNYCPNCGAKMDGGIL